jgi:hypothetical protein
MVVALWSLLFGWIPQFIGTTRFHPSERILEESEYLSFCEYNNLNGKRRDRGLHPL